MSNNLMKVEKIYFDMDGVLADFERGVKEICGLTPPSQNAKHHKPGEDDEMWEAIKAVVGTVDILLSRYMMKCTYWACLHVRREIICIVQI